jgi:hypothetical protein
MNRAMVSTKLPLANGISLCIMTLILGGCHYARIPTAASAPSPPLDSIALISVTQLNGSELERDKPAQLVVRLTYTLNSYDSASLSLSLDEFSNPTSCIPKTGEPFRTVDIRFGNTARTPISRGTHVLEVPVKWPDVSHDDISRNVPGPGTISFHSSMWLESLDYRFLSRSFGTEYCERFAS